MVSRGELIIAQNYLLLKTKWEKLLKNAPSKICREQPVKNKCYDVSFPHQIFYRFSSKNFIGPFFNTSDQKINLKQGVRNYLRK